MEDRCREVAACQIGLEFRDLFAIVNVEILTIAAEGPFDRLRAGSSVHE